MAVHSQTWLFRQDKMQKFWNKRVIKIKLILVTIFQAAEKRLKDGEKEREERTRRQREEKERRYREEREKQEARREKQRVDLKPTAREGVGQKVTKSMHSSKMTTLPGG